MKLIVILISLFSLFVVTIFESDEPQEEITVFMVGDSTMADKPYAGSNPEKGWGQVFPLYFKEGIRFENHAKNGRSAASFRSEGRWDVVMDRMKSGDYVIIEFGHNDEKINKEDKDAYADSTFRQNLTRFIKEVREKGGKPVLATPISRRSFDENGVLTDTHGKYSVVVREVARDESVPLFELHTKTIALIEQFGQEKSKELFMHYKPGDYSVFPDGKEDNTHLSPTGAFKVSDLAVEELRRELPELVKYLKD